MRTWSWREDRMKEAAKVTTFIGHKSEAILNEKKGTMIDLTDVFVFD